MDIEAETKIYYELITLCLIEYGNLEKQEAQRLIADSKIFNLPTEMSKLLFFHEEPYYWAMSLIYGWEDQSWYQDATLWPIPASYRELEKEYYANNGEGTRKTQLCLPISITNEKHYRSTKHLACKVSL